MPRPPNSDLTLLAVHASALLASALLVAACGSSPADPDVARADASDAAEDASSDASLDTEPTEDTTADAPPDAAGDTAADSTPDTASDVTFDSAPDAAPVCPDPDDPGVDYLSRDADFCATASWGCDEGWEPFEDPECGCGCTAPECPTPSDPTITYVADDPEVCAVIDYVCPDGMVGWGDAFCGCGCALPEDFACEPERFAGTSGMAEPFGLDASCEFLVACSNAPLSAGLGDVFLGHFPDARCGDGRTFGCPEPTASFCEAYVEVVEFDELVSGCAISAAEPVDSVLCGGDM